MPRSKDEASKSGLFWCSAHGTEARLQRYRGLVESLAGEQKASSIDLRQESGKKLGNLLADSNASAWLVGVWVDGGLRRPDGLLPNSEWVDNKSCQARMACVSAYPVSAPPKNRYYETSAHEVLPRRVLELRDHARAGKTFPEVKDSLDGIYEELREIGGFIAVSSCGKFLIISE